MGTSTRKTLVTNRFQELLRVWVKLEELLGRAVASDLHGVRLSPAHSILTQLHAVFLAHSTGLEAKHAV